MTTLQKLKLPIILVCVLMLPLLLGNYVPMTIKALFLAISVTMKSLLVFVLPVIIFSFVAACMLRLQNGALLFVLLLVSLVFISNLIAIMVGYGVGYSVLSLFPIKAAEVGVTQVLNPTWDFVLPKLIKNNHALLLGVIVGVFASCYPKAWLHNTINNMSHWSHLFLQKVFVPILPFFILGFVFKMEHEEILATALRVYGPIFLLIISTQIIYISFLYLTAAKFSLSRFFNFLNNVFPASLTGFTTISSAASMPVLIFATEKNLPETPERADMIIPAVINIHTLGSAIGVAVLSLATLLTFGHEMPNFWQFFQFALLFAAAKYATAAVPGGVVLIVSPVLESVLGFSEPMIGLITAVYLILDPFGTTANVTANGAFPLLFNRCYDFIRACIYGKEAKA